MTIPKFSASGNGQTATGTLWLDVTNYSTLSVGSTEKSEGKNGQIRIRNDSGLNTYLDLPSSTEQIIDVTSYTGLINMSVTSSSSSYAVTIYDITLS